MHKVSPLVYCNMLEFLKAISGGFGRAIYGHNSREMENTGGIFPFSNLAPFLWLLWKEKEKVGLQYHVKLFLLSSITQGSHDVAGSTGTAK